MIRQTWRFVAVFVSCLVIIAEGRTPQFLNRTWPETGEASQRGDLPGILFDDKDDVYDEENYPDEYSTRSSTRNENEVHRNYDDEENTDINWNDYKGYKPNVNEGHRQDEEMVIQIPTIVKVKLFMIKAAMIEIINQEELKMNVIIFTIIIKKTTIINSKNMAIQAVTRYIQPLVQVKIAPEAIVVSPNVSLKKDRE
uniref:Uncharacterized protein n=1 Tax=Trichogramma kaykai TaxID=54128 RepID=A0ABD2VU52_9HYME